MVLWFLHKKWMTEGKGVFLAVMASLSNHCKFWKLLTIFYLLALSFCKLQLLFILNICFAWQLACFSPCQLLCWHNCELSSSLENWTMTGAWQFWKGKREPLHILKKYKTELITPLLPPRRYIWPWPAQSHRGAAAGVPQKCLSVAPLES